MIADDLHSHPELIHVSDQMAAINQSLTRAAMAQRFRDFLKRCSNQFPHTVFVAGNHEFYHGKWEQTIDTLRDECNKLGNVHFLEKDTFVLDDITFIGGTLWTNLNNADHLTEYTLQNGMNDYRIIRVEKFGYRRLRPTDTFGRHVETLKFIDDTIKADPEKTYVVVGHHSPSRQSIHPRYENDYHMNGGYSSDLNEFITEHPQILLWTHGHTHHEFDYVIGNTRVVCNPRGYIGYERDAADPYDPMIIDIA